MASWSELKEEGDEFMQWAESQRKLIRIDTQQVPRAVLPQDYNDSLILHDMRVTGYGPDDKIYDQNEELRKRLARGNLVIRVCGNQQSSSSQDPPPGCYLLLYALKKFTGGFGDDDDRDGSGDSAEDQIWKRYFTEPIESAVRFIRTRKANGEAFHLAALKIHDSVIFIGGSKNTHLMFSEPEHIEMYTESRYRVAREFCSDFLRYFRQLPSDSQSAFTQYLIDNNVTAVFEILYESHQHVELLTNNQPLPVFVTFTSNRTNAESATQVAPNCAIDIARSFGLQCIEYQESSLQQLQSVCDEIRHAYGYEGEVLYFLNSNSHVIGLLKKKTAWYIILRALREKLKVAVARCKKAPSRFNFQEHLERIERRLKDIQSWLNFEDSVLSKWLRIGELALNHCVKQMSIADNGEKFFNLIHNQFPVFWQQFLQKAGVDDSVFECKD